MLYNLEPGREPAQIAQMIDLEKRAVCVFCPEAFPTEHREPVELDRQHWFVTGNDYPYQSTSLHLLVIPKVHVPTFAMLSHEAVAEFGAVVAEVEQKWHLQFYALGMRSGDFHYNGSTIEHLHAHIVVADPDPDQKVRFAMSRNPQKNTP